MIIDESCISVPSLYLCLLCFTDLTSELTQVSRVVSDILILRAEETLLHSILQADASLAVTLLTHLHNFSFETFGALQMLTYILGYTIVDKTPVCRRYTRSHCQTWWQLEGTKLSSHCRNSPQCSPSKKSRISTSCNTTELHSVNHTPVPLCTSACGTVV